MGVIQKVIYAFAPAAEAESRSWVFRCPQCQQETSIHDLGGVRFKAAGNPVKFLRCKHCQWCGLSQIYKRGTPLLDRAPATEETALNNAAQHAPTQPSADVISIQRSEVGLDKKSPPAGASRSSVKLWIDGAGCWKIHWGSSLTIGGPTAQADHGATLSLLADLSRQHVTLERQADCYQLVAHGPTSVNGERLEKPAMLRDGDILGLASEVKLRFRIPSELGLTAVLEPISNHRMADHVNGVVLLQQHLLIGSGHTAHIRCPNWNQQLVLFVRDNTLWVRADKEFSMQGEPLQQSRPLNHGDILIAGQYCLRLEVE